MMQRLNPDCKAVPGDILTCAQVPSRIVLDSICCLMVCISSKTPCLQDRCQMNSSPELSAAPGSSSKLVASLNQQSLSWRLFLF